MRALFAPLQEELKSLRPYLMEDAIVRIGPGCIWRGKIGAQEILLARCGIGAQPMQRVATFCVEQMHATELLLFGFAGATTPRVGAGDLILGTECVDAASEVRTAPPPPLLAAARHICTEAALRYAEGPIVTATTVVASPHEKAFFGTRYDALAVEMEGAALAATATRLAVPWLHVRAILDTMDTAFPEDLAPIAADGTVAYGRLGKYLCRHPRDVALLAHLYVAAVKAREALTTFVKRWIAR